MRRLAGLKAWWPVAALGLVALAYLAAGAVRTGGYLLAACLALAAVLRLGLPEQSLGGLRVRGRWADAICLFVLAGCVAVGTAIVVLTPLPGVPGP